MRIFGKTLITAMSIFTAASIASPVLANASVINDTSDASYTVRSGDSFWKIAQDYDIPVSNLIAANSEIPIFNLQIGSNLIIPLGVNQTTAKTHPTPKTQPASKTHTVASRAKYSPAASWQKKVVSHNASAGTSAYSQNLYWLAHVINAEANAEPMKAQIAVGDVVMHRLKSSSTYKSVHDVVFSIQNGHYQFTCVENGYIYSKPSAASISAAHEVLDQHIDVVPGSFVFFNPSKTPSSSWVWSQPRITQIGDFIFSK